MLKLGERQDITALALNKDNTNLLVSTADKQLIIFTDPAVRLSFFHILALHQSFSLNINYLSISRKFLLSWHCLIDNILLIYFSYDLFNLP